MVLGGDKLTVQLQANGKKALEACIPGSGGTWRTGLAVRLH